MPGPQVAEGDRIEVVRWGPASIDDNLTVPPGTHGTVQGYHPDVDQVWVVWDTGSNLSLMISHDTWRRAESMSEHTAENDAPPHDTVAHVLAGGFGIRAKGCPACEGYEPGTPFRVIPPGSGDTDV
jgi:hypothetical protein